MPPVTDYVAAAVISVCFVLLLVTGELWRRWGGAPAEATRKLVHLGGGGVVCLLLPFVIDSPWVVMGMAIGMAGLLMAGRVGGFLPGVHGIGRVSRGSEYYPLVIFLLFWLCHGEPWKYTICVLVLAVADTCAALVGSRFGRIRYESEDSWKSLEGSLAFMAVTFVAAVLPLLFWPGIDVDFVTALLVALLVGMLVTTFEAVALEGSDNLWAPLGTYFVLSRVLQRSPADLMTLNVSFLVICALISFTAWRMKAFNVGGMLVFTLAAFASWALGSFDWALPVFAAYGLYLVSIYVARKVSIVKIRAVTRSIFPPLAVLLAANLAEHSGNSEHYRFLYGPYLAGCVMVLVQAAWNQIVWDHSLSTRGRLTGVCFLTCLVWMFIAGSAWCFQSSVSASGVLCVLLATLPAAIIHDRLVGAKVPQDVDRLWIATRMLVTCFSMFLLAALQLFEIADIWNPS